MQFDLDEDITFEATHPETGIPFTLKPMDAPTYNRLRNKAKRAGEIDLVVFGGLVADESIKGWEKTDANGQQKGVVQECTKENRIRFGQKYALSVMPWVTNQCMDATNTAKAELDEAKNG
jgi:hypothetical protein